MASLVSSVFSIPKIERNSLSAYGTECRKIDKTFWNLIQALVKDQARNLFTHMPSVRFIVARQKWTVLEGGGGGGLVHPVVYASSNQPMTRIFFINISLEHCQTHKKFKLSNFKNWLHTLAYDLP